MTVPVQNTPATNATEQKPNDKEYNFRQLEAKYQRELAQERAKREEAERVVLEVRNQHAQAQEDESNDNDPYVDHKKLEKRFSTWEQKIEAKIDQRAELKARTLIENQKKETWMRNNPD